MGVFTPGDLMAIIAIHPTILTILGALCAYGLYVYGKTDDLQDRVFRDTARINDLKFAGAVGLPFTDIYVTSDADNRRKLIARLVKLATGEPVEDLSTNPADQGDEALRITSAISSYYPFPTSAHRDGSGRTPRPVRLESLPQIRQWVLDMDQLVSPLLFATTVYQAHLKEALGAASARHDAQVTWMKAALVAQLEKTLETEGQRPSPGQLSDLRGLGEQMQGSLLSIATSFLENLPKAKDIVESTKTQLSVLGAYQRRHPSKWTLIVSVGLSGLALLVGVFYPIAWLILQGTASVPGLRMALLVPLAIYALIFGYVVWILSRV